MRRNYNLSETTVAFIKWRQCLIIHNDNQEENQPEMCKKLHIIYDNLIEKEKKNLKEKRNILIK